MHWTGRVRTLRGDRSQGMRGSSGRCFCILLGCVCTLDGCGQCCCPCCGQCCGQVSSSSSGAVRVRSTGAGGTWPRLLCLGTCSRSNDEGNRSGRWYWDRAISWCLAGGHCLGDMAGRGSRAATTKGRKGRGWHGFCRGMRICRGVQGFGSCFVSGRESCICNVCCYGRGSGGSSWFSSTCCDISPLSLSQIPQMNLVSLSSWGKRVFHTVSVNPCIQHPLRFLWMALVVKQGCFPFAADSFFQKTKQMSFVRTKNSQAQI